MSFSRRSTLLAQTRLIVINYGNQEIIPQSFSQTQKFIRPEHIFCQTLPLASAFNDLQHGQLSTATEDTLNHLIQLINPLKLN